MAAPAPRCVCMTSITVHTAGRRCENPFRSSGESANFRSLSGRRYPRAQYWRLARAYRSSRCYPNPQRFSEWGFCSSGSRCVSCFCRWDPRITQRVQYEYNRCNLARLKPIPWNGAPDSASRTASENQHRQPHVWPLGCRLLPCAPCRSPRTCSRER